MAYQGWIFHNAVEIVKKGYERYEIMYIVLLSPLSHFLCILFNCMFCVCHLCYQPEKYITGNLPDRITFTGIFIEFNETP